MGIKIKIGTVLILDESLDTEEADVPLTVGEEYKVLQKTDTDFVVKDDNGDLRYIVKKLLKDHFRVKLDIA